MTETRNVTQEWAQFALGLSALPPGTRDAAAGLLAQALGVGVANAHGSACTSVTAMLAALEVSGSSPVLGRREQLPPAWAALVGGAAMQRAPGINAPIFAAALTVAELVGANLDELLRAAAVGIELTERLDYGLSATHVERGWDPVGTLGHVGAAAATATLLRLPPERWCYALAIAATQAAGHMAQRGTSMMAVHAGKAASDAVEAALLAEGGFTGPVASVEGTRGLAALLADGVNPAELLRDLGGVWETDQVRRRACGTSNNDTLRAEFMDRVAPLPGIDAALLWRTLTPGDGSIAVEVIFSLTAAPPT
jgi:2-methylcitrate dehydratase PrpD